MGGNRRGGEGGRGKGHQEQKGRVGGGLSNSRAGVSQSGQVRAAPTQKNSGVEMPCLRHLLRPWCKDHLPPAHPGHQFLASLRHLHVCTAAPVLGAFRHKYRSCPWMAC